MAERKLDVRSFALFAVESLLAFSLVVILSLAARFFYSEEQPTSRSVEENNTAQQLVRRSSPQSTADAAEELRYNPARTNAYVKSVFATVMASAKQDAAVIDYIPYGSLVDLGGWDAGRKFVKIKATPSASGYVSISDLTYEDPASQIVGGGNDTSVTQTWKLRFRDHLSGRRTSSVEQALEVDASGKGLVSNKSLSEFFDILRKNPSKSNFYNSQTSINYAFLARDLDGRDTLIYPRMSQFISHIKNLPPGPGVVFDSAGNIPGQNVFESALSQSLMFRFTKEPLGLIVRPLQELSNVGLSAFEVACEELSCLLRFDALPSRGSTALSALVMGQVERSKPTMVVQERDSGDVWFGFLDVDGDRQYDAAVYVTERFADVLVPATVYVAENHQGAWRLKYIRDEVLGHDSPRVSIEPGVHKMPINVRLFSDGDFGITYTLDGTDPSCPSPNKKIAVLREAEIFIDRTTSIKAKACGRRLKDPSVVTFNYDINN